LVRVGSGPGGKAENKKQRAERKEKVQGEGSKLKSQSSKKVQQT
jgi:hypothetical protein